MIDAAIRRIRARDDAELVRREIEERLAIERLVLECSIRFPWMEPADRRRLVIESFRPPPAT